MGGYKQIGEVFFTTNPAEGAKKRLFKRKGRPFWYLLIYEGGNKECKDKVQQTVLIMNPLSSKTNHQIPKSCAEQDPNERYAGARTDLSEKIFVNTHKNEPSHQGSV